MQLVSQTSVFDLDWPPWLAVLEQQKISWTVHLSFFGAPTDDGGGITGLTGATLPIAADEINGSGGLVAVGAGAGVDAGFVVEEDDPIAPFLLFTVGSGLGAETLTEGAALGRGGTAAPPPTVLSEGFETSIVFGLGVG